MIWRKLNITLEMIKFEHTVFALPFALIGALLASGGLPRWWQLMWILVAMVGARSAAMARRLRFCPDLPARRLPITSLPMRQ